MPQDNRHFSKSAIHGLAALSMLAMSMSQSINNGGRMNPRPSSGNSRYNHAKAKQKRKQQKLSRRINRRH